jgi:hypothetical protein
VEFGVYGHPQPEFVSIPEVLRSRDLRQRFPVGAILASVPSDAQLYLYLEQRGVALRVVPGGEIAVAFVQ